MVYYPGLTRQNWPRDPAELDGFYGNPRGLGGDADPSWKAANLVPFSYPWHEKGTQTYLFHKKALPSLLRVLNAVWDYLGHDQSKITFYHLDETGGTFAYRANRNNPAVLSNHSRGIAIDLAPDENPNRAAWVDQAPPHLPRFVVEAFKQEGWRWGGDFSGTKDAMHFEAVYDQHHDQPPVPAPAPPPAGGTAVTPAPAPFTPAAPAVLLPGLPPLLAPGALLGGLVLDAAVARLDAEIAALQGLRAGLAALARGPAPAAPPAPASAPAPPVAAPTAPATASASQASTTAPLAHFIGKCSWFGGPDDTGVAPSEGLAIFSSYSQAPNLFLAQQPPGTTGLARRLNPAAFYIACRWDYHRTPAAMLRDQSVQVMVRANGRELLAHPADWGPNENTGRVADLSPGLMAALGITTDDQVEVIYPATKGTATMSIPSTQSPPPEGHVAVPVGSAATSKVNLIGLATIIIPPLVAQAGGHVLGLNSDQIINAITVLTPILGALVVYFRTFKTTQILPQSLPPATRSQLGV